MNLVALIAELEERIQEVFRQDIIIADERAMSRTRSPFHTVDTLVDHILELLEAEVS